jgi:DtxR family Mn-dependent transcriptional regulator
MMMKDVWKKFDETELTHSSVHHLLAVNALFKVNGYARSVDISNYLNISRASVSITVNKLKDKGFLEEDVNRFIRLSEKGTDLVNSVLSKRRIIQQFFQKVLELNADDAEINACKIEHLLSEDAGRKLLSFTGFFLSEIKEAQDFRDSLREFSYLCNRNENCSVCEIECYYSGQETHV